MDIISHRTKFGSPVPDYRLDIPLVYHASPTQGLTILEPKKKTVRDPNEGSVIFASPDLAYASMFLFEHDHEWVRCGLLNDVHVVVISDKRKFKKQDKGGSIYSLPAYSFYCDLGKGGREREWVSRVPVVPMSEDNYSSALDAMLSFGIQIYFVNKKLFAQISKAKDHGLVLLRNSESENAKLGVNFRQL